MKLLSLILVGLLVLWGVTLYLGNSTRYITDIDSDAVRGPVQQSLAGQQPIEFTRGEYSYELEPLYAYELTGLVVERIDFTRFSLSDRSSVFPMDVCVIWGDNLVSGIHRNSSVRFSQDMRFCWYRYKGGVKFHPSEFSNNHLIVDSDEQEKLVKQIKAGDQVRIQGMLVNATAQKISEADKYNPEKFSWSSSVDRSDTGAGACETIYVTQVEILKPGNVLWRQLNVVSVYGLVGVVVVMLLSIMSWPLLLRWKLWRRKY